MTYTSDVLCFPAGNKKTTYNAPCLLFVNSPFLISKPKAKMRISKPPALPAPLAIAALLTFIFTAVVVLALYLLGGRTTVTEYERLRQEGHMVGGNTRCCCCCCSAVSVVSPGSKPVNFEPQKLDEVVVASGGGPKSMRMAVQLMLGLAVVSLLGAWLYKKGCGGLAKRFEEEESL
jgi:hypothetical protein